MIFGMATIDVAMLPSQAAEADIAVVIDTIRATTTIAYALAAGYQRIICIADPEAARAEADILGSTAILAGEHHGDRIAGFELGNSPSEFSNPRCENVVFVTRNGVQAIIQSSTEAATVLCGSLANLGAVAQYITPLLADGNSLVIRCAGTRGAIALEDCYTAGALISALGSGHELTDSAQVSVAVTRGFSAPLDALLLAQSTRNITPLGHGKDVEVAAKIGVLDVVPLAVEISDARVVLEPV